MELKRCKPIGNKRYDITDAARALIVRAYKSGADGDFKGSSDDGKSLVVKSRIFDGAAFGYTKVTVVTKDGKDTENVPLGEDIDAYMAREVLPYSPTAKVNAKKSKVGYETPFTRTFYEYKPIEPAADIAKRIEAHEKKLMADLKELFGKEAK